VSIAGIRVQLNGAFRSLALLPVLAAMVAVLWQASGAEGAPRAEPARARTTYLSDCATCHGPQGSGTSRGPTLKGVGAASVDFMVRSGRMPLAAPDDQMKRRTPKYSGRQLNDLISYASSLTDGGPAIPKVDVAAGDVARGAEVYRLQCAACHSWAGTGGALEGRQAPPVTPASSVQIAEAVRTGPGTMPVFGRAALSPKQVNDLTAYVRTLDHPDNRGGSPLKYLGPVAEGAVAIVIGLGAVIAMTRFLGERG
jgi:ubiquinol-cytochrome c reductase cytochrome c subunit